MNNTVLTYSAVFVDSLYQFYIGIAWDSISQDKYVDNWHIKKLCMELKKYKDAIVNRQHIDDMIINIPPGCSKSSIISQTFPVWLWLHDPTVCIIVSSYSNSLSTDHSMRAKSIIQSDLFQQMFQDYFEINFDANLDLKKDNEGYWIDNFGGQYVVTSTGGTVTGRHAHLIIRDDPMNPDQAYSDAYRQRAHRFNDRTLPTRKKNKNATPTITVMQRLHQDDTTGHDLAKTKNIYHICLPATKNSNIKPKDYEKYYIDNLLDINRMPHDVLLDQEADLMSFAYSCQYGQEPFVEGGNKIKEEWFCFMDYGAIPRNIVWDMWIDGAYTEKTSNDPTGIMICGYDIINEILIVRHFEEDYMKITDLINRIEKIEHGFDVTSTIYIEPKASGYSILQILNDEKFMNARKITGKLVSMGKETRLNTSSPRIGNSRVWLVNGNWNKEFIKQHTGFPAVAHDEAVDLLGYACAKYF